MPLVEHPLSHEGESHPIAKVPVKTNQFIGRWKSVVESKHRAVTSIRYIVLCAIKC